MRWYELGCNYVRRYHLFPISTNLKYTGTCVVLERRLTSCYVAQWTFVKRPHQAWYLLIKLSVVPHVWQQTRARIIAAVTAVLIVCRFSTESDQQAVADDIVSYSKNYLLIVSKLAVRTVTSSTVRQLMRNGILCLQLRGSRETKSKIFEFWQSRSSCQRVKSSPVNVPTLSCRASCNVSLSGIHFHVVNYGSDRNDSTTGSAALCMLRSLNAQMWQSTSFYHVNIFRTSVRFTY